MSHSLGQPPTRGRPTAFTAGPAPESSATEVRPSPSAGAALPESAGRRPLEKRAEEQPAGAALPGAPMTIRPDLSARSSSSEV